MNDTSRAGNAFRNVVKGWGVVGTWFICGYPFVSLLWVFKLFPYFYIDEEPFYAEYVTPVDRVLIQGAIWGVFTASLVWIVVLGGCTIRAIWLRCMRRWDEVLCAFLLLLFPAFLMLWSNAWAWQMWQDFWEDYQIPFDPR